MMNVSELTTVTELPSNL